jgi:tRNA (Thr-GGU) A37 N-methylase
MAVSRKPILDWSQFWARLGWVERLVGSNKGRKFGAWKLEFTIKAIGYVRGGRAGLVDDHWGDSESSVELDPTLFTPDALAGLDAFSHAEVIFLFDKVPPENIEWGARHPRGRGDWPLTGIFAQRGKNRPNRLGLTICKIKAIQGLRLSVVGLDAINGTPVIDIKPVMREFLPQEEVRQPAWVSELMMEYW